MVTIAYFSPTGNTLHLAKKLQSQFETNTTDLVSMTSTKSSQLKENNHLVLMYSIHAFNAPQQVKTFVKGLPNHLFDAVSIIGVGCNTTWINDASSLELRNILIKKGYSILVDKVIAMPLTFIMNFPEKMIYSIIAESEQAIISIAQAILSNKSSKKTISFKSKTLTFVGRSEKHAAKLFGLELHATKKCISCGKCWNTCPSKNIKPNKHEKPKFGFKCIMCMKCIYDCPSHAITPRISKFIPIKGGYSIDKYL